MSRYDPHGRPNLGQRILGGLLLVMLGLMALVFLLLGLKWIWQQIT